MPFSFSCFRCAASITSEEIDFCHKRKMPAHCYGCLPEDLVNVFLSSEEGKRYISNVIKEDDRTKAKAENQAPDANVHRCVKCNRSTTFSERHFCKKRTIAAHCAMCMPVNRHCFRCGTVLTGVEAVISGKQMPAFCCSDCMPQKVLESIAGIDKIAVSGNLVYAYFFGNSIYMMRGGIWVIPDSGHGHGLFAYTLPDENAGHVWSILHQVEHTGAIVAVYNFMYCISHRDASDQVLREAMNGVISVLLDIDKEEVSAAPDANCVTRPDGECVSEKPCMHTPKNQTEKQVEKPADKPVKACSGCGQEVCKKRYHLCHDAGISPQSGMNSVVGFQLRSPPRRPQILADDQSEPP